MDSSPNCVGKFKECSGKTLQVRIPEDEMDRLSALLRVAEALAAARAGAASSVAA